MSFFPGMIKPFFYEKCRTLCEISIVFRKTVTSWTLDDRHLDKKLNKTLGSIKYFNTSLSRKNCQIEEIRKTFK